MFVLKVRGGFLYEHQTRVTSIATSSRTPAGDKSNEQSQSGEGEEDPALPSSSQVCSTALSNRL